MFFSFTLFIESLFVLLRSDIFYVLNTYTISYSQHILINAVNESEINKSKYNREEDEKTRQKQKVKSCRVEFGVGRSAKILLRVHWRTLPLESINLESPQASTKKTKTKKKIFIFLFLSFFEKSSTIQQLQQKKYFLEYIEDIIDLERTIVDGEANIKETNSIRSFVLILLFIAVRPNLICRHFQFDVMLLIPLPST